MIFCPNFSNKQVKQEFEELVQAVGEDMAYLLWDRNNGYALDKAPNGADSRLFKDLLDYYEGDRIKTLQAKGKVYLQQFKDQFGDWLISYAPNLEAADYDKVDIVYFRKPWKNDNSKSNDSWRIYLKNQHEKGYFELVKDQEGTNYSVHFKTSTEKHLSENTWDSATKEMFTPKPSTKEERALLFDQLRTIIPEGGRVSTWGELSAGGVYGVNKVGKGWNKVGERHVKTKDGDSIVIPIYQKPSIDGSNVSEVVDENGEPLIESTNFKTESNNIQEKQSESQIQSTENIIKNTNIFNRLQNGGVVYSSEILDELMSKMDIPTDIRTLVSVLAKHNVAVMYTDDIEGFDKALAITRTVDGKHVIVISKKGIDESNEELLRTMIHEIVHTLTTEELKRNPDGEFAKRAYYLYNKYKGRFKAYGFTNMKEFVAEFASNNTFRSKLLDAAFDADYKGLLGKIKQFIDVLVKILCKKSLFNKNLKEYQRYKQYLTDYLYNKEQIQLSGAENTQQLNEYLSDTEREYFISKENKPGNKVSSEVTQIINDSAQRNTTPTDDQISEAELNARERDTLEFDEEERRQIDIERKQLGIKNKMRKRYQEAKRAARKAKEFITYRAKGLRNTYESKFDDITTKIIEGTISKDKAYRKRMKQSSLTSYQEQQVLDNQEAVREVKKRHATILEAQRSRQANLELLEKLELFVDFLQRANDEISEMYKLLRNARANRYRQIYYKTTNSNHRIYTDADGKQFTSQSTDNDLSVDEFGFDELQYTNTDVVGYYDSIINSMIDMLDDINDMLPTDGKPEEIELNNQVRQAYDTLRSLLKDTGIVESMRGLKNLYKHALQERVEDVIDQVIDEQDATALTPDMKARMKITAKKWLRNQNDFGDVGSFEKWIGLGSRSKSSIIRIVQEIINQDWDKIQTSSDEVGHNLGALYQKALGKPRNIGYKFTPRNFAKRLMAMDYRGLPTGYFIQPINKGQYYQDLNDIKTKLLYGKDGVEDKIRNFKDDDGNYVFRDANNEFDLELNEYGDPIFPESPLLDDICRDYYIKIESWISDHANRRYTKKYYVERVKYLSPSTLRLLHEAQSKINSIRSVATVNGEFRPDMLTPTQLEDLSQYQQEYADLSNPYNPDGTTKNNDDIYGRAAQELLIWQAHMRGKLVYESDLDAYHRAEDRARDKDRFRELFTKLTINPLLWKMISKNNNDEITSYLRDQINQLKQRRSKLVQHIKTDRFTKLNWDLIVDRKTGELKAPEFWSELKRLDSEIAQLTEELYAQAEENGNVGNDENFVSFSDIFDYMYLSNDPEKDLAPKYEDSMMYEIVESYRTYLQNAHPEWSQSQIDQEVSNKFWVDGQALSIFSTPFPKNWSRFTYEDNTYPSIVRTPNSMFMKINMEQSDDSYLNYDYDENNPDFIQPKDEIYHDERYDEFINESQENRDLYNALIDTMKESFAKLPFVRPYDYRLPQIGEDRLSNIMMRNIHSRFGSNLAYFFNRKLDVNETDVDIVQDGTVKRPDGSTIKNIPIRFIQMLDKPEYISSDVVGNVIQFFRMAENYRLKSKSAPKLMSILDAVAKNNEDQAESNPDKKISNQQKVISDMLDRQLFEENTTGLKQKSAPKKWKYFNWLKKVFGSTIGAMLKRLGQIRSILSGSMLKLNLSAALTSLFDPLTSLFINSVTAKYYGVKDLSFAIYKLFINLPTAIMSLGSTRTYNKITAAMQYFGISKDTRTTFRRMDEGALRRFLTESPLMKIFQLGDYSLNAINMVATLHAHKRYVDNNGNVTYLSKYDFINKAQEEGLSVKEAKSYYRRSSSLYRNLGIDRAGNLILRDSEVDTKSVLFKVGKQARQTGSYLTGVVGDTERTGLQTNIFTAFLTMMRNFLIVGFWERFGQMRDFQVQGEPVTDPITGEVHMEYENALATNEQTDKVKQSQVYYRGGFDFSTGRIENPIFNSFFSCIRHLHSYLQYAATSIHTNKYDIKRNEYLKEHNLNEDDIRQTQRVLLEISAIGALLLCSIGLNYLLKDKDPDDDDYYLLYLLNLLTIRLVIDRAVWFSPSTLSDIITSITPANGGVSKVSHIMDIIVEGLGLSKHKLSDPVKSGNYKDKSRLFYHTFNVGSVVGLNSWYTNMPKFLGGGGAYVINQKTRWYKKVMPLSDYIYGERNVDKDKKKKRKSTYVDPEIQELRRELRESTEFDKEELY